MANGKVLSGWALSMQGQRAETLTQIHQGMTFYRVTWAEHFPLHQLALLAEAYGNVGQAADGLRLVVEALATENKRGERYYQAELYRLKGELLFVQESTGQQASGHGPACTEIEACFRQALAIARSQQAKS